MKPIILGTIGHVATTLAQHVQTPEMFVVEPETKEEPKTGSLTECIMEVTKSDYIEISGGEKRRERRKNERKNKR